MILGCSREEKPEPPKKIFVTYRNLGNDTLHVNTIKPFEHDMKFPKELDILLKPHETREIVVDSFSNDIRLFVVNHLGVYYDHDGQYYRKLEHHENGYQLRYDFSPKDIGEHFITSFRMRGKISVKKPEYKRYVTEYDLVSEKGRVYTGLWIVDTGNGRQHVLNIDQISEDTCSVYIRTSVPMLNKMLGESWLGKSHISMIKNELKRRGINL